MSSSNDSRRATVSYTHRLDRLLGVPTPTSGDIEELRSRSNSLSRLGYFFDRLTNSLARTSAPRRLLPQPSGADPRRRQHYPAAQMAGVAMARAHAAVDGAQTASSRSRWRSTDQDPRVHEDLADVGYLCPLCSRSGLVPRMPAWLATPYHGLLPRSSRSCSGVWAGPGGSRPRSSWPPRSLSAGRSPRPDA